jgi:hypothetical protein
MTLELNFMVVGTAVACPLLDRPQNLERKRDSAEKLVCYALVNRKNCHT